MEVFSKRLSELSVGEGGVVAGLHSSDPLLVRRLVGLGLVVGATVRLIGAAPLGDPLEINAGAGKLSLRRTEAHSVAVEVRS